VLSGAVGKNRGAADRWPQPGSEVTGQRRGESEARRRAVVFRSGLARSYAASTLRIESRMRP